MLGSLGNVVFEISVEQILTFDDLSFQHSASYTEHAIHGRKGLLEFTGFSATTASLNIFLNADLGIDPKKEFNTLKEMFDYHEAVPFILDDEPQGEGLWVIESISEKRDMLDNKGIAKIIEVSLNLKEYVEVSSEEDEITEEEFNNDYYGLGNW